MSDCGTIAGYHRHRRARETTCEACRGAVREYVRQQRAKFRDACPCGAEKAATAACCRACSAAKASLRAAEARATKAHQRKQLVYVGPVYPVTWLPPQHPVMRPHPKRQAQRTFVAGSCNWCGASFVAVCTTGEARYCSKVCMKRFHAKRGKAKRGKGFHVTRRTRLAIYARDEATCQLCLGPVDLALPPGDIWSATLDHIVPQSKGGTHEPENLRLAHLWCNSVRGDDTYYTAADLAA